LLLTLHRKRHRRRDDLPSKIAPPEQLSIAGVECEEMPFAAAGEQDVRLRRENSALAHVAEAKLPHELARRGLDGAHGGVAGVHVADVRFAAPRTGSDRLGRSAGIPAARLVNFVPLVID